MDIAEFFLLSTQERFGMLKRLGDKAIAQVSDADLHWTPDTESNTIAIIIQHLQGNMLSRWTNFLDSDGEKSWHNRDGELEPDPMLSRKYLLTLWEGCWGRLFTTLGELSPTDLTKHVTIRQQKLTVPDAILRQLSHYAYHIGQMVYIAKVATSDDWQHLSIPKGRSRECRPPAMGPVD